jgi:hypothetical protein
MAVTSYSPLPTTKILEPVTCDESAALFAETGHPVSKNTLIRWAREKRYSIERVRRTDYVSYSDLLEVHGERFRAADA